LHHYSENVMKIISEKIAVKRSPAPGKAVAGVRRCMAGGRLHAAG